MTRAKDTAARIIGSLHTLEGKGVVRMECRFSTDIDDIWSALTDPQRLARWIANVQGDLHPGGRFHVTFTSSWDGPGRVDVCEPPVQLLVTMSQGQEDETIILAEVSVEGDQSRLVIEERGLPVSELAAHGAGWQTHVEDLATYLAGRERTDWRARWIELIPFYQAMSDRLA